MQHVTVGKGMVYIILSSDNFESTQLHFLVIVYHLSCMGLMSAYQKLFCMIWRSTL